MIDTHCHLDDPRLENCRRDVMRRARQAGVDRFVVAGTGIDEWPRLQQLRRNETDLYAAYGIHPWYCHQHQVHHLQQLTALLDGAVALGECGLDATPGKPDAETQLCWLRRQLAIADTHKLPVILHCVRAGYPLLKELRAFPSLRGVVHGFSGSLDEAERFMALGYYIGCGAMVLRERAIKARRLASELPLDRLMLETDAPDGLPGELNEPANLTKIAETIAGLRGDEPATIIAASDANAIELFRL